MPIIAGKLGTVSRNQEKKNIKLLRKNCTQPDDSNATTIPNYSQTPCMNMQMLLEAMMTMVLLMIITK